MSIFEKFAETRFLKEDSELEKKVNVLKSIKDDVSPECKEKYEQDLKLSEFGLIGENRIAFELKNADIGCFVLRDINIEYNGDYAQIDYVIVTRCHCYFVECKNMIGNITVNSDGEFQREYVWEKKKNIVAFYSPYRQALRHIEIFKKIWRQVKGTVFSTIGDKIFDDYYKPLIILANPSGILDIKNAPKEIRQVTIRVDQLVDYLKKDLKEYDNKKFIMDKMLDFHFENEKEIRFFADGVLCHNKERTIDYAQQYVLHKEQKSNEEIRKKLVAFRTQKSKENKVPAYCVFLNVKLDEMIEKRPENIEELGKILSPGQLKQYGQDIVRIINE